MMRYVPTLFALAALLAGCGGPEAAAVVFRVRIDAQLRVEVESLSVYALHPNRSDNIQLTCTTLVPRAIDPTDSRVRVLARKDVAFTDPEGRQVTLEGVEAGDLRLVYVEARDSADALIGNGCADRITVEPGESVAIDLLVSRVP